MNTRSTRILLAALPVLLAACGGKKEEPTQVKAGEADTAAIEVVTTTLKGSTFEDWGTYPADLRGGEDAVLVSSASGMLRSVSEVGRRVVAGQALCDIDADRYKAQLDAAKAGMDAAQTAMDVARKNVEAGSLGKVSLDNAAAAFYGAQSQYMGAKKQWEDSRCQAPFSGIVASRMVERWQAVGAGTPTLRIVRNDRLEATFAVPEAEASSLKPGNEARFVLLDDQGKSFPGRVTTVDLAADARNRVISARVVVGNVDSRLRPGMAGKVRILRGVVKNAVVVPSYALLRREGGVFAMVVKDGLAHEVSLTLGSGVGDSVYVSSGLKSGDKLVVRGAFRLSEGVKVRE